MRFGFVTCVNLGLACMEQIYKVGGELALAVTLPDDKARAKSGRIYLDDFCWQHRIDLVKSPNVNDDVVLNAVGSRRIDWLFIIGWSQIARSELLKSPSRGVLGMHPTLLPQGRGRASIPWAILKGLDRTGVTVFKLDEGVDTGPILAQEVIDLSPRETATSLYDRVTAAHSSLMARIWPDLVADRVAIQPQDSRGASLWPGRRPEDGRIDTGMCVEEVDRLVRAVTRPYPGAFLEERKRRVRIWSGRPLISGRGPQEGYLVALADGNYLATEYEIERVC